MFTKVDLINKVKNVIGWKTKKKIVVFSVDDYGNVRVDSKQAREKMNRAGLEVTSRFDAFDALETKEDLIMLFEALSTVKDKNGHPAIFTPFALPCNINFEKIIESDGEEYEYELLTETFRKLKGYNGVWKVWQEGMEKELLCPQFHGREHLNVKVFNYLLRKKDKELKVCLENRSYTSITGKPFDAINYTAAFDFQKLEDNKSLKQILVDGLECFNKVFGYRPTHFMPPMANIHSSNYDILKKSGIEVIDIGMIQKQHQGDNNYKTSFNYSGKKTEQGPILLVRNCVFEPTEVGIEFSIRNCLSQIKNAFAFNKPAIISSHRVNFCGHIDQKNRQAGIKALTELLKQIVKQWPDVEFMSSQQLITHMGKR